MTDQQANGIQEEYSQQLLEETGCRDKPQSNPFFLYTKEQWIQVEMTDHYDMFSMAFSHAGGNGIVLDLS